MKLNEQVWAMMEMEALENVSGGMSQVLLAAHTFSAMHPQNAMHGGSYGENPMHSSPMMHAASTPHAPLIHDYPHTVNPANAAIFTPAPLPAATQPQVIYVRAPAAAPAPAPAQNPLSSIGSIASAMQGLSGLFKGMGGGGSSGGSGSGSSSGSRGRDSSGRDSSGRDSMGRDQQQQQQGRDAYNQPEQQYGARDGSFQDSTNMTGGGDFGGGGSDFA